jgi:hypothetical protein
MVRCTTPKGEQLEALLRARLDELEGRYRRERTPDVKNAFLITLELFTALVLHNKRPTAADLKRMKNA